MRRPAAIGDWLRDVMATPARELTAGAKTVAWCLASIADAAGYVCEKAAEIAKRVGLASERSAREHLDALVLGGWLLGAGRPDPHGGIRFALSRRTATGPVVPVVTPPQTGPTVPVQTGPTAPVAPVQTGPAAPVAAKVARAEISLSDLPQRDLHKITTLSRSLASDARARGGDQAALVCDAYGTSLGAAGASYVPHPSRDAEPFRVAAECMATAEPGAALRDVAARWTREYVAERRTRLPAYFAEWCQKRLAKGHSGYAMPSSNHRSTPIEEQASAEDLERVERGLVRHGR